MRGKLIVRVLILSVVCLVLAACASSAQQPEALQEEFLALDADKDLMLSYQEFGESKMARKAYDVLSTFSLMDVNANGFLEQQEFVAGPPASSQEYLCC